MMNDRMIDSNRRIDINDEKIKTAQEDLKKRREATEELAQQLHHIGKICCLRSDFETAKHTSEQKINELFQKTEKNYNDIGTVSNYVEKYL